VLFEPDGANDDYAYSSIYEDTAMLFEEVMMKHYFDVDREMAFTDKPPVGEEEFCESYPVRWGFRHRSGDFLVKARAELVLQLLLDKNDVSTMLNSLGTPARMTNLIDWCTVQNLNQNAPPTVSAAGVSGGTLIRPDSFGRHH
jgi:hypothetical protein